MQEQEEFTLQPDEVSPCKIPRHVSVAIRHLLAQKERAEAIRDKAWHEVESLDAALKAIGWKGEP